jgi:anaerobic selenocysteine-containing dehydrogenase
MIRYRKGEAFTPVTWEEAIRYTAHKLSSIKAQHGPRSIMTTGSRGTGNETNYVMQKFARGAEHQQRGLLRARLSRPFRCRFTGNARQRRDEQLHQRY